MVVVDISDAFMSLGVTAKEIPHTLAPHVTEDTYYAFIALLFGFKRAPLLWCRVGALLARLLQSLVASHEGQHQMYTDDALWFLQGDLATRNLVLSMLLTTTAALGFKWLQGVHQEGGQIFPIGLGARVTYTHRGPLDDGTARRLHPRPGEHPEELGRPWNGTYS